MDYFTYLWTNECRLNMQALGREDNPLSISAGSAFTKRSVRPGDKVYVVAVHQGDVYLIGRMKVKRVWNRGDYDVKFRPDNLWDGDEVIDGEEGTPMKFDRVIPPECLENVYFESGGKKKGLLIEDGKLIEPQSLRSVRRLSWEGVSELDRLLKVTPVPCVSQTSVPGIAISGLPPYSCSANVTMSSLSLAAQEV